MNSPVLPHENDVVPIFNLLRLKEPVYQERCERCGLTVEDRLMDCPYCDQLSDAQMLRMLDDNIKEKSDEAVLIEIFVLLALITIVMSVAVWTI